MIAALIALAVGASSVPTATESYRSSPPRRPVVTEQYFEPSASAWRASVIPALMQDFGERYIYADANRALAPPRADERRVVFLGDSITDGWNLANAFPGRSFINRGIGAQVTAQMLVRFEADVVALRPRAVVLLGGTNDIAGVFQTETPEGIISNIEAMGDIALRHGIAMVVCALLPVNNYTANAHDMLRQRPPATIDRVNVELRRLALRRKWTFVDYGPAMRDARGLLDGSLTADGLHPNAAGYRRMARHLELILGRGVARIARQSKK